MRPNLVLTVPGWVTSAVRLYATGRGVSLSEAASILLQVGIVRTEEASGVKLMAPDAPPDPPVEIGAKPWLDAPAPKRRKRR